MKTPSVGRVTSAQIGLIATVLVTGVASLLFLKTPISISLRSGDIIKVDFARDYKVRADLSKVKVAGVPVGVITHITRTADGGAELTLKVDKNIKKTLGTAPTAALRPTTILGGTYYVELTPGGDRDQPLSGTIPASRTSVPVELDAVVGMFDGNARTAIQNDVRTLDNTFTGPASSALQEFVATTPRALQSDAQLLNALAGTQPSIDLTKVVSGFESLSRQLDSQQQDFNAAVGSFQTVTGTLNRQRAAINQTVVTAPAALRNAQEALTQLNGVLDQVRVTARGAGPSVTALTSLLRNGRSDLESLRPVVRDLRPLLVDLDPTIASALPAARYGSAILDDIKSPVIDRISGPIIGTLTSPVHGKGSPLTYQQVAYMVTLLNLNSMTTDHNGAMINFQPGIGPDTTTEFGSNPTALVKSWQQLLGSLKGGTR